MRLVTVEEIVAIEKRAIEEFRIPSILLMENAGIQVAKIVQEYCAQSGPGRRVLVLAGKGNNAGDGFVVARHLVNAGFEVRVFLLARFENIKGDARVNLDILRKQGLSILPLVQEKDLNVLRLALLSIDLVVDGIYGTGFQGVMPELTEKVIQTINIQGKPIVSIDVPSGLEVNTGKIPGEIVKATCTVTLALPKLGLALEPGTSYVGDLRVVDISIPRTLLEDRNVSQTLLDWPWCFQRFLPRRTEGHKGDYGHVLLVGGSPGLTGAVALASEGALRVGAGLVTAGVPISLYPILENKLTEVMTQPLAENASGHLDSKGLKACMDLLDRVNVVAIGPGLGRYSGAEDFIQELLSRIKVPVVIDADALNAIAKKPAILEAAQSPMVLTPHPGEMARLLGCSIAEVQGDRLVKVRQAAKKFKAVVALKGSRTLIAEPTGQLYLNSAGNPGMATGGTGDILTGMIAGLIAQGIPPREATGAGVFLHGLAGDAARETKGMRGLIAGDLLQELPGVMQRLEDRHGYKEAEKCAQKIL